MTCQEIDGRPQGDHRAGYGEYFIHRMGHGIGLTTQNRRTWSKGNGEPPPGMCFSIEPGIYLPGRFGVRIEDIVTVTPTEGATQPHAPRDGGRLVAATRMPVDERRRAEPGQACGAGVRCNREGVALRIRLGPRVEFERMTPSRLSDAERELYALRSRAYGPEPDIDADPAAIARLIELEPNAGAAAHVDAADLDGSRVAEATPTGAPARESVAPDPSAPKAEPIARDDPRERAPGGRCGIGSPRRGVARGSSSGRSRSSRSSSTARPGSLRRIPMPRCGRPRWRRGRGHGHTSDE